MFLKNGERIDDIGFGNIKLIQKAEEFCYGVDAVIVADFVASIAKKPKNMIDLGTGSGVIPLILSHKFDKGHIVGIEVQEESANRASRSVEMNDLKDKIKIVNDDVLSLSSKYDGTMDVVVTNPPYMIKNGALKNTNDAKTIARHETTATLKDFLRIGARVLKDKGELFMVHRPSRLVDILSFGREVGLEGKTMRLVLPKDGEQPNIMLIHFVKNGGKELKILNPLTVHRESGGYTDEILRIYEK